MCYKVANKAETICNGIENILTSHGNVTNREGIEKVYNVNLKLKVINPNFNLAYKINMPYLMRCWWLNVVVRVIILNGKFVEDL